MTDLQEPQWRVESRQWWAQTGHTPELHASRVLVRPDGQQATLEETVLALNNAEARLRIALEALARLVEAADAHEADQSGVTDERFGFTQPITLAEGKELSAALAAARRVLEQAKGLT